MQNIVPIDDFLKTAFERGQIEFSVQTQAQGQIVSRGS
jgi:hypothetical protein